MRIVHLSDLHLGKRVNEFSMLEDQEYILLQILQIIAEENPDAVIIAGDVYDKPVPPAEAMTLFDSFLTALKEKVKQVFVISGNHDSAERIAFGGRIMDDSGIHVSPVFGPKTQEVELEDEYGKVRIHLLPFIKPAHARAVFPDREISTYTEAVAAAVDAMEIDPAVRNVLVTHQFVTGGTRSESEDISVGGTDNVDASVFDAFDYVALGHLHGPQQIGTPRIRYCGTPLKYSFSEKDHVKSVTVAELKGKGDLTVRTVPLTPKHDMREIKGTYDEVTLRKNYEGTDTQDYLHVVLTDEEDVPDAVARLRVIYPNLMKLDYDNIRTRTVSVIDGTETAEQKTEIELFEEFFEKQNGRPMSGEQRSFSEGLLEKIREAAE